MDEVDEANANRVLRIRGADIYVAASEGTPPKLSAPRPRVAVSGADAGSGITLLKDLLEGAPVDPWLSTQRAAVCVACPHNNKGDWTRIFTVPAAHTIRLMLEARSGMNLATPHDPNLVLCELCECPLRLKVHVSREVVQKHTSAELMEKLPAHCWIKLERK